LVVALSQKDALLVHETLQKSPFNYKPDELLLVHSKQDELENRKAFLLGRKSPNGLSKEDQDLWHETRKVKVIIAVSMLREGWDVRNIAVICLFRKFSYQKKGDMIYTVYGPQIIGRGLRRIRPAGEPDHLFAIDHPAFNHSWLWKLLSATEYAKPLNPGDAVLAENIVDVPKKEDLVNPAEETDEKPTIDIEKIIASLPDTPDIVPIPDWQKHFTDFNFEKRVSSALQKITNVKSQRLGSANTAHEIPQDVINVEDINEIALGGSSKMTREELIRLIIDDIANEPHQALIGAFRQETAEQLHKLTNALEWIIKEKFGVEGIDKIDKTEDGVLAKMYFCLPQIFEEFRNPALILGILGEK
jgi:hypothetical protein